MIENRVYAVCDGCQMEVDVTGNPSNALPNGWNVLRTVKKTVVKAGEPIVTTASHPLQTCLNCSQQYPPWVVTEPE